MANKISCPKCPQKFRTETGRDWHLDHIHNSRKHSSNLNSRTGTKLVSNAKIIAKNADLASNEDLLALRRELDEMKEGLTCRLDINLKRAAWLSSRIEALEKLPKYE